MEAAHAGELSRDPAARARRRSQRLTMRCVSGAATAPQEAVDEARALADMRVQRNPVEVVAQNRIRWDFLPRPVEIGLPIAVLPLVRLHRPAIAVTFIAATAGPAGFRLEGAIPIMIRGVAIAPVAALCPRWPDQHDG